MHYPLEKGQVIYSFDIDSPPHNSLSFHTYTERRAYGDHYTFMRIILHVFTLTNSARTSYNKLYYYFKIIFKKALQINVHHDEQ